ncbi:hypothetical protein [Endozoicomonas sp. GU-1]|uniref:hypothetical protein n=1 Tax=Endozoicomonas sp. GU-1 TaxID=3009078 RepID=UPI0022B31DDE|nr:hypothetical protein [Endozoicomonas sp. GU-1]WBA83440.1 hypothetical protein O2T12_10085 [Endozoicomonas sp. GU-1]WBA86372.1 hypothetical protein O3276_24755 [Endozoicomonas sp. GU-1]
MQTKTTSSTFKPLLTVLFILLPLFVHASHQDTADMEMKVNADIPELIALSGLPANITLNMLTDGTLASDLIPFQVNRNGASAEKPKRFRLTISSSEGERRKKYFLARKGGEAKMYIHAGLAKGEVSRMESLERLPASGIASQTTSAFGAGQPTHTLALFNNNVDYLQSQLPGEYSASFTITVQAQ